jgi:2-polyprenyl-6-methoxyphenol hydroxylase-like FAD-dependent oxidoreductase
MAKDKLKVAIVGAGMGGLAAAAALRKNGIEVTVYEQARQFTRLGAGIQIGCNAMHVLRGLGLEQRLRAQTFYPRSWNNRDWRTGEILFDMIFGPIAEQKYGAPYLLAHRGDLHEALASAVPDACVRLDHRLVGLDQTADGVRLSFANGDTAEADAVVGADGVHSIVGDILFGETEPHFTGRIAYRTTFPAKLLDSTGDGGRDLRMREMVGRGPPHRHVSGQARPQRSLFRHQPARAGGRPRILVGRGRREGAAGGVRRLSPRGAARAGRLPVGSQADAGRSRAA